MTEEQLARLRSWAATLVGSGSSEKDAAGRTIETLADRVERLRQGEMPYWDQMDLLEAKRLARQLGAGEGPPARRSAARAILLLGEEHERLAPPQELVRAWRGSNGGNGSNEGRPAANGKRNGNGHGGPLLADLPRNGSSTALRAPRRMPLPEQRRPQRPPPRDPDDGGLGAALGDLRPSGGAIRRALYWLIGAAIVVGTFMYAPRLAAPEIERAGSAWRTRTS